MLSEKAVTEANGRQFDHSDEDQTGIRVTVAWCPEDYTNLKDLLERCEGLRERGMID